MPPMPSARRVNLGPSSNSGDASPAPAAPSAATASLIAGLKSTRRIAVGGGGEGADVSAFEVPRAELLRNIRRFQARDRYCWALPLAMLGFALWSIGLTTHADVPSAAEVEAGCVAGRGGAARHGAGQGGAERSAGPGGVVGAGRGGRCEARRTGRR